jgi:hypothetical protein
VKFLLYCIFSKEGHGSPVMPLGIDNRPVYMVSHGVLAGAVSAIDPSVTTFEISRALAYHNAVSAIHEQHAVIPLRLGALFDTETDVERLLESRQERYKALLAELEDCVEMGIRIILNGSLVPPPDARTRSPETSADPEEGPAPGRAYLSGLKDRYSRQSRFGRWAEEETAKYRSTFEGLFRKFVAEVPNERPMRTRAQSPLLSLYFLVPRSSLHAFGPAFDRIASENRTKILLTGPWPPYNFVLPADPPAAAIG